MTQSYDIDDAPARAAAIWKNQSFMIAHADAGPFEGQGLRPFFGYRQLGIAEATLDEAAL